jgi:hypothetical protein
MAENHRPRFVQSAKRSRPPHEDRSLANDEPVIYGVGTYPEPNHDVALFHGKRPVMRADPRRPKVSEPFEMQGRMLRISAQQSVGFVR